MEAGKQEALARENKNISLGSLAETKYLLYFSNRLGYFRDGEYIELKNGYNTLGKILWRFYESVRDNKK